MRLAVLTALLCLLGLQERTGVNARLLRRPAQLAAGVFGAFTEHPWRVVGDHAMLVLPVSASPLALGQPLGEHPFSDASVSVLGIDRRELDAEQYLANPFLEEVIRPGDHLVLYGPVGSITALRNGQQ